MSYLSVRVYLCSMHALFWVYVLLTMNHPGNPFTNPGAWLDARARCKTLRLLHATAPGAARFSPWAPWEHLSIPRADAQRET